MMLPEETGPTSYRAAVAALDAGEIARLAGLLARHPSLVGDRCRIGEWYEMGYFKGATLLHHVAGNPIRCLLPANILDVARVLLEHNADPNAATDDGGTTISLILTSWQASEAGVALPLIDLLRAAGADHDLSSPDVLTGPILNQAPATAAELVRRGATMDIRHAAGLGRLDALEALLAADGEPSLLEEALAFACVRGQDESVRVLLRHGAHGDILVTHGGRSPCTALHEAANRGYLEIVRVLLAHGANATVVEPQWGGTPAGWAEHGGHLEIAALLRQHASNSATS
jgi:ankyrin repeat protein